MQMEGEPSIAAQTEHRQPDAMLNQTYLKEELPPQRNMRGKPAVVLAAM
jgi:hypothetical protein